MRAENIPLTPAEEKLLEQSARTDNVERFRMRSRMTGVLFSILFILAWFSLGFHKKTIPAQPEFEFVLGAYALMTCLTIWNFKRMLDAYRGLLNKIKKDTSEPIDPEPEKKDFRNLFLLTGFYCVVLIALGLRVLPQNFLLTTTVLFLLLSSYLKGRFADHLLAYKKTCREKNARS